MSLSRAQIDQLIDLRITDALTRQNTADKVREVLHEINSSAFNSNDDAFQWGSIGGDIEDQTDLIDYIESQIPDVSDFLKLAGTDVGFPITGDVEVDDAIRFFSTNGTLTGELQLNDGSARIKSTGASGYVEILAGGGGAQVNSNITGFAGLEYASDYSADFNDDSLVNLGFTNLTYQALSEKNQVNGYAGLDSGGKIVSSQLPALAITDTYVVASQAAMLALSGAETGDVAVRSDLNKSFILAGSSYSTLGNWQELLTPTDAVLSFNTRVGAITLLSADVTTALGFTPESALGNPATTGFVLSSTTGGARSWINVTSSLLTGFASSSGVVSAADSILTAFNKVTGNISVVAAAISGKEDSLGNPGVDGYVLSSTAAGVRSWVAGGSNTYSDSVFRIFDNGDATKQLAWEVSGIATGTTRTITSVNYSGTSVLSNGALTDTRIPFMSAAGLVDSAYLIYNGTHLQAASATGADLRIGSWIGTPSCPALYMGVTGFSPSATNYTIVGDGTNTIINAPASGGQIAFRVNGVTGTPILSALSTGVTIKGFSVLDTTDATKKLTLSLSGITTGTTRTLTVVDYSGTMVLSNGALTASKIPYYTASGLADGPDWDGTNSRLGIGMSSTTARLSIAAGSSTISGVQLTAQTAVSSPTNGMVWLDNTDLFNFKGRASFVTTVASGGGGSLKIVRTGSTNQSFITFDTITATEGLFGLPPSTTGILLIGAGNSGQMSIGVHSGVGVRIDSYANAVTTPNSTLQIGGSMSLAYVAKTANYTATINDYTIECTANTFTITLPTAVGITGRVYVIKNTGAGTITVGSTSAQTFDGAASLTIAGVGSYRVQSNGANWIII